MGLWRKWREERALQRRAAAFVRQLEREPDERDVRWLSDHATHGVEYGRSSMCTSARPLTGCRIAVVVVSSQSASTTLRVAMAMPPTCRRSVAANRWKAEPTPAPNRMVDDSTWIHLSRR